MQVADPVYPDGLNPYSDPDPTKFWKPDPDPTQVKKLDPDPTLENYWIRTLPNFALVIFTFYFYPPT